MRWKSMQEVLLINELRDSQLFKIKWLVVKPQNLE